MTSLTYNSLLSLFIFSLVTLGGCGSIEKSKKNTALEAALSTYREAIRWGYFETAYGYIHPEKRKGAPPNLENIRVTSYEVMQAPLLKDEQNAEQVVRIEYVHRDEQKLRSLSDRQLWRYDEATKSWWLYSGVPRFK